MRHYIGIQSTAPDSGRKDEISRDGMPDGKKEGSLMLAKKIQMATMLIKTECMLSHE